MIKRIKMKRTQEKAAKLFGVSQGTISNWLKMTHKPTGLQRKALEEKDPELLKRIDEAWLNKTEQ